MSQALLDDFFNEGKSIAAGNLAHTAKLRFTHAEVMIPFEEKFGKPSASMSVPRAGTYTWANSLYGEAFNGLWAAYFGTTAADGGSSISQALTKVGQTTYVLSFELANDNGGLPASNSFVASLGGTPVLSFTDLANQPHVYEQYVFVATGSSTVLSFFGFNDQSYLELDNVSFSAVPEPAAFALLLAGVLVVGIAIRAREAT